MNRHATLHYKERAMKIEKYPKTLPRQEQYTAGEVAILYGVSHRTACKMIDNGTIAGFTVPGSKERRVLFASLAAHVKANPAYAFVITKILPA
jgi:hypothetical protein